MNNQPSQYQITYVGIENPIAIKFPMANGKACRQGQFGIEHMEISGSGTQPINVGCINLRCKQLVRLFSTKGSQHNLILTLHHTMGRFNHWVYDDQISDNIVLGHNPQQLDLSLTDQAGKLIDLKGLGLTLSFKINILCIY